MGCARSKNKSPDEKKSTDEMEGSQPPRRSNDSLIITVIWRRLSMFSRRGSSRKQSTEVRTAARMKAGPSKRPSDTRSVDSRTQDQKLEQFPLPDLDEKRKFR